MTEAAAPEVPRALDAGDRHGARAGAALVVGAILIAVGDEKTRAALGYFFQYPQDTFSYGWSARVVGVRRALRGRDRRSATFSLGELQPILSPISETLLSAAPADLRRPLRRPGVPGGPVQHRRPGPDHHGGDLRRLRRLRLAAADRPARDRRRRRPASSAGRCGAGSPAVLKARTGAHEVITTIMLNYVALNLLGCLLSVSWFQAPPVQPGDLAERQGHGRYPHLLGGDLRVHSGLILAIARPRARWWLLDRSTLGFRLRAVGANPSGRAHRGHEGRAARTSRSCSSRAASPASPASARSWARTRPSRGPRRRLRLRRASRSPCSGRATPGAPCSAGLLFGALRAGSLSMQARDRRAGRPRQVLQALIVLFIAAPPLIRALFRLPSRGGRHGSGLAKGWNG